MYCVWNVTDDVTGEAQPCKIWSKRFSVTKMLKVVGYDLKM